MFWHKLFSGPSSEAKGVTCSGCNASLPSNNWDFDHILINSNHDTYAFFERAGDTMQVGCVINSLGAAVTLNVERGQKMYQYFRPGDKKCYKCFNCIRKTDLTWATSIYLALAPKGCIVSFNPNKTHQPQSEP